MTLKGASGNRCSSANTLKWQHKKSTAFYPLLVWLIFQRSKKKKREEESSAFSAFDHKVDISRGLTKAPISSALLRSGLLSPIPKMPYYTNRYNREAVASLQQKRLPGQSWLPEERDYLPFLLQNPAVFAILSPETDKKHMILLL